MLYGTLMYTSFCHLVSILYSTDCNTLPENSTSDMHMQSISLEIKIYCCRTKTQNTEHAQCKKQKIKVVRDRRKWLLNYINSGYDNSKICPKLT